MKNIRIIARLDIKGPNLVKGIHLEGLRVLGKPEDFAQHYYEQGADELFYQDVVASLYNRNSLKDIITTTAKKSFIPLTVSGGIRCLQDISEVLRAGADKVCINTAAIKSPSFIKEASLKYGSSTIVVSIEAIKQKDGNYMAFVDNGREYTGKEVLRWAQEVQELGAGEIVITSVDKEGTGLGYDLELIKKISTNVNIPVIAHGGPGKMDHIVKGVTEGLVDALALASIIHYDFLSCQNSSKAESKEGNFSFLKSGIKTFGRIEPAGLRKIKRHLLENNINTRP